MIRELFRLCQTIVHGDRIRISPSDGRLLRLQPPAVLMIGSETLRILSRSVSGSTEEPVVTYDCETEFGSGTLVVQLQPNHRVDVVWKTEGRRQEIAESDIVVFA